MPILKGEFTQNLKYTLLTFTDTYYTSWIPEEEFIMATRMSPTEDGLDIVFLLSLF